MMKLPSACLLKNGEILAAASEERFMRVKQDNSFPKNHLITCSNTPTLT